MYRVRVIRYYVSGKLEEMPIPANLSDEAAATIALALTGIIYERQESDWTAVIIRPSGV